MTRRIAGILAGIALVFALAAAAVPDAPPSSRAADIALGHQLISLPKLKMHLSFLASDELEGRGTPSRGLDLAARYLAAHLEYYGYQPAGDDGTFYQKIAMSRRRPSRDSVLRVESGGKSAEFKIAVDFMGAGSSAKGQLAFAGYGARATDGSYDDYAGLDVKDKLVIVFDGYPAGMEPGRFRVERKFGTRTAQISLSKYLIARERGAVGAITLKSPQYTERTEERPSPFDQSLRGLERESMVFDFQDTPRPTAIDLTAESAGRLGELLGLDLAAAKAKIDETQMPQ